MKPTGGASLLLFSLLLLWTAPVGASKNETESQLPSVGPNTGDPSSGAESGKVEPSMNITSGVNSSAMPTVTTQGTSQHSPSSTAPATGEQEHVGNSTNLSNTSASTTSSPEVHNVTTDSTMPKNASTQPYSEEANSTIPSKTSTKTTSQPAINGNPRVDENGTLPHGSSNTNKGSGQTGQKDETPKQDKNMLWILLPVVVILVAGIICVLKKCNKVNTHTDTAENGTENASFQSRSDSNKDGVMLLGVKTSAGEDNAAAR
ncbi:hypothetical protein AGOR_G00183730 [Albula goreensis]|uniref:Uncharacterized protein n=1 Tax=Albula goreensis TaxID=1534307 RepID=A0A8T3CT01_9TELE|nr:hypothetical protein AGOR_G00183730 [Albula goreensis]